MGVGLKAPLTSYDVIYTLPMLTIKEDKGECMQQMIINPRAHMCSKGYVSLLAIFVFVCLSACLSVTTLAKASLGSTLR